MEKLRLLKAVCIVAFSVATTIASTAQTLTTQLDFTGSANGATPLYGYPVVSGKYGYGTTSGGGAYDQGTVFQATQMGTILTTLYTFCSQLNCTDGAEPLSGPIVFGGNIYGTTEYGGANGAGTVFEVTPAGQLTTLYSFCSQPSCTDGAYPIAGLVQVGGNFYGTAFLGGAHGLGTVFEITPAGQLTTLYSFCSQTDCADGLEPWAGLVQGGNGNLFGTTLAGGAFGAGTVFQITPGGTLTRLYSFCSLSNCADGADPYSGLVLADGNLYGTTYSGGANGVGTVFEITLAGQLTTLYSFCSLSGCTDGLYPYAGLILATDGNLYGTTGGGTGPNFAQSGGTVFGMTPAGQLTTLYNFCSQVDCADGAFPFEGLVEGEDDTTLYGATSYGGSREDGTIFSLPVGLDQLPKTQPVSGRKTRNPSIRGTDLAAAPGVRLKGKEAAFAGESSAKVWTAVAGRAASSMIGAKASGGAVKSKETPAFTNVFNFDGANGAAALTLIQGNDGNFYGTTESGETYDEGTVFQLTPAGTLANLYTFCSQTLCTDGDGPVFGLVQGANGNFYGTTVGGGANDVGTVFELTSAGQLTTLYSFCSQPGCADGVDPIAGLMQANNGNFYGTTAENGANGEGGTVFEITPAGQLTTLYSFCSQPGCTDGQSPRRPLLQASNGNLYGTTLEGGAFGAGTVFQMTPGGTLTRLYSFCSQEGCTDGTEPRSELVQATNGNLYGTTSFGGANGAGTVFQLTPGGVLTTLYSFCSQPGCTDGANPYHGLVLAYGNFYGTTLDGGSNGWGTVFEITPAGQLTTLHEFGLTDGANSDGQLLLANGTLYGTTLFGGNRLDGVVFSLPPLIALSGPTGTATVGVAYSSALTATGGDAPYTFSITSGSLPPSLTLNASTGAITGMPTTAGIFSFIAQVVDSVGNQATASCSITVASTGTTPSSTSLSLAPSSIPVGSAGPVVMTATVAPTSGSGTPTGTVAYFNGSTQVGTGTLSGGVATFNYNPSSLGVGIYSITATYSGDNTFAASTSPVQTLAITQPGPFAYVANIDSDTVSVINIPTSAVANTIPTGEESGPWGVAVSPDQTQVYVSNNHGNSVSVINTASNTVVATIQVQSSPFGVAFTPDGTAAYVVNGSSNSVSVINTATQTVIATVPVQSSPVGIAMALTSNGTFAYVANSASNTVSVIAVATNTVVQTINVGSGPRWVAVTPNSSLAYVENAGSNNVSVISVASNTVTATIPVGTSPFGAAFTPDSSTAYVANSASNTVSVINTASSSVVDTVPGFNDPVQVALTADGSSAFVTNINGNNVSVITTSSNTITATVPVGTAPVGVAIASAPPTTLQITQPLNPTQPNMFSFGTNSFVVQYPPGTSFSGVNMTVTDVEITQAQFAQRVAGTQFAGAACIVYEGKGGNCVDEEVTCSDNSGNPITCPSEVQPTIAVQTNFTTLQGIVNPGYLTTPIGLNQWTNIFSGFSDPTVHGKTKGFSEFVAVELGAADPQGVANFKLLSPKLPATYCNPPTIPLGIKLTSVANGSPITDAEASVSVVKTANGKGKPTDEVVFSGTNVFKQTAPGDYKYVLQSVDYAAGTYALTIYGNAFPAYQGQFVVVLRNECF